MKVICNKEKWYPVYEIESFDKDDEWYKNYPNNLLHVIEIPEKKYTEYQRVMKEFEKMQTLLGAMILLDARKVEK